MSLAKPVLPRFLAGIQAESGSDCWIWKGCRNWANYGTMRKNGKNAFTHRIAWEIYKGEIPKGLFVLHRCDNPPCCNPEHLFLGTPQDNSRDMTAKGRHHYKLRASCRHGHPFTEENIFWYRGSRICRHCTKKRQLRFYLRRRAALDTPQP